VALLKSDKSKSYVDSVADERINFYMIVIIYAINMSETDFDGFKPMLIVTNSFEFLTVLGPMRITFEKGQVRRVEWVSGQRKSAPFGLFEISVRKPAEALVAQLGTYLAGGSKSISIKVEPVGTPFQLAVWRETMKIPFGQTRTYQEIASAIGRPRAVRAVGTALGRNPLCLIVPCHRVVATGGGIGGYAGGLRIKRALLQLEGAKVDF
jgi:O-6-methylguanine DNA methyltransferase